MYFVACLSDFGTFSRFRFGLFVCNTQWGPKSGLRLSCFIASPLADTERESVKERWRVDARTHPRVVCVVTSFAPQNPKPN